MKLYSIENNCQKRYYYIADDTKDFIDMITKDLAKKEGTCKKDAKNKLKDYDLCRYNNSVEVPLLEEEGAAHIVLQVSDLLNQYPNYKGNIGYALMSQYYFE